MPLTVPDSCLGERIMIPPGEDFSGQFMITAWSSRPNSYPLRTKIKVKLSPLINHYFSTGPFHFDACEIFVTS